MAYDPIEERAFARNSSTCETGGEKQLMRFCAQKFHHSLSGLAYCAMMAFDRDAKVASNAEGGVPLIKKAWRITWRLPGKSCSRPDEPP